MNIYLIAQQLESTGADVPRRMLDAIGPEHVKRIVQPQETWLEWGNAVFEECMSRRVAPGSIRSLEIAAHGGSGRIFIGTGLGFGDVRHLAPLARFVAPAPASPLDTVVLNGCNVASSVTTEERMFSDAPGGSPTGTVHGHLCTGWALQTPRHTVGYHLLLNLARVFHGTAAAGLDSQPGGVQWDLVGPTLRVRPDGSYDLFGYGMDECVGFAQPS
jgi:hypothetical protein